MNKPLTDRRLQPGDRVSTGPIANDRDLTGRCFLGNEELATNAIRKKYGNDSEYEQVVVAAFREYERRFLSCDVDGESA